MAPTRSLPAGAPRYSLRLKLALCMVGVALVIQLLLGLIVLYYQNSVIDGFFNTRLEARIERMGTAIEADRGALTDDDLMKILADRPRLSLFPQSVAAVYASDGSVVASSIRPAPSYDLAHSVVLDRQTGFGAFRAPVPGLFGAP